MLEGIQTVRDPQILPIFTGPTLREANAEVVGPLRADEVDAIDVELVPLCFTARHRMIVEHEAPAPSPLLEEGGRA
jgi:hypothetical protein